MAVNYTLANIYRATRRAAAAVAAVAATRVSPGHQYWTFNYLYYARIV